MKIVENMKYVRNYINIFVQFLFQETTEKAFWQVDMIYCIEEINFNKDIFCLRFSFFYSLFIKIIYLFIIHKN